MTKFTDTSAEFQKNVLPTALWVCCFSFFGVILASTQGIIGSANFRFLQRLSVIFGFHRDCPRTLASCRDYCPRKMASCRDCPRDSASCREPRQEAESHGQSLQEAIYHVQKSLAGSKRSRTISAEAKYDGQSLQEAKIGRINYTLCQCQFQDSPLKKVGIILHLHSV